jgi:hypothetical protein
MSEAAVTAEVNRELEELLKLPSRETLRSYQKEDRTLAKQLYDALTEVETLLASARGQLAWSLFYPLWLWIDGGMLGGGHLSMSERERANQKRNESFAAELQRLRSVCAQALNPGFGDHPNYDLQKHYCARSAHDLMQAMSDKKITGTEDNAFRVITSLLYEAVSGQQGADLKRACDSRLRKIRGSQS